METAKLLLIESRRATAGGAASFAPALEEKGYAVHIEHTGRQALHTVQTFIPDLIIIDAASMKTSGTRICHSLRARLNGTPILLVAGERATAVTAESSRQRQQPGRQSAIRAGYLTEVKADCSTSVKHSASAPQSAITQTLVQPFTSRKLLNRVARLLPCREGNWLEAGPIKLNLAQQRVSYNNREDTVTLKQAKLLEVFLQNPGRLLTRKFLMKQVWETDFMDDTRTLDVHISWLRRVIEPDPSKPRYLKTVRGVGYWLEVPEEGSR